MKRCQRTIAWAAASIVVLFVPDSAAYLARSALAQSSGAPTSGVSYAGGDGGSFASAILIKGARNESEGVAAERIYVVKFHPDWDPGEIDTALLANNGRYYDLSHFRSRGGVEHGLYFDVTEFFGKY